MSSPKPRRARAAKKRGPLTRARRAPNSHALRSVSLVRELRAEIGERALSDHLRMLRDRIFGVHEVEESSSAPIAGLRRRNAAAVAATREKLLSDTLSSDEVGRYVGRTRPVVNRMAKEGSLLAVPDGRALRFPRWQFDEHTEDGMVPDFRRVLATMDASPFRKAVWFITPHPRLEDRPPIDLLRSGDADRVLVEAKGVTSG